MTMLQLAGPPAATAFRLDKLRTELRALTPAIADVAVRFEHFVHVARPLTERERRVLEALLDYGGGALALPTHDGGRAALRRAAARHDLAVGVESHRHREALRAAGAPRRARPASCELTMRGRLDGAERANASRRCCTTA